MTTILILLAAGFVMWALRASAILAAGGRTPPELANRALGYAKHAVLAAVVVTSLRAGLMASGSAYLPQVSAALAAAAVAWWTRGMVRTMVAGIGMAMILAAFVDWLGMAGRGS